jgi:hypothetical protein
MGGHSPTRVGQGSQTSPRPSRSASAWPRPSTGRGGLNTAGQRSTASDTPSPSWSVASARPVNSPGRMGVQVGSPAGGPQKKSS